MIESALVDFFAQANVREILDQAERDHLAARAIHQRPHRRTEAVGDGLFALVARLKDLHSVQNLRDRSTSSTQIR